MKRLKIEVATINDGEQTWWTYGIYRGCQLVTSAGDESYPTRKAALDAAREAKRIMQEGGENDHA